jgi:hypothetical protein
MVMSWEGYSWLQLKACGVSHDQLLNVLQPYHGRRPSTEAEFNAMQLTLRRMGTSLNMCPEMWRHSSGSHIHEPSWWAPPAVPV